MSSPENLNTEQGGKINPDCVDTGAVVSAAHLFTPRWVFHEQIEGLRTLANWQGLADSTEAIPRISKGLVSKF